MLQLCSLRQGTVSSPWSIVPRWPRVLQVLPTMSYSWECESWDTWELFDIVGSICITLGQSGTTLHGSTLSLVQREKLHRLDRPLVVSVTSPRVLTCISMETLSNAISLRVSRRWIASGKSFVCRGSKSVKSFGANQEVMDANRMRWEISCGPATDSFHW